ncbi:MAG: hypothetical protein IIY21_05175 [Clostridiales bacterium]|nr:hypothetical protein [Clostridiales bacterium]
MAYYTTYNRGHDEIFSGNTPFKTFESALKSACEELEDVDRGWMEIDDGGIIRPLASVHRTSAKRVPTGTKYILYMHTHVAVNGGIGVKTDKFYVNASGKIIKKQNKR